MKQLSYITKLTEYQQSEIPEEYSRLIEIAKQQTQSAYVPYSKFHVGAAVLLDNDMVVGGNNQENAAYPSGTCAERTAIFYANSQYPEVAVRTIAIAAYSDGEFLNEPITPCGSCRQVLLETENRFGKDIAIVLYGREKTYVLTNVAALLPLSFGRSNLFSL